jgi:uncharacterized membrane protein YphA (DoxX/SURF4 family)
VPASFPDGLSGVALLLLRNALAVMVLFSTPAFSGVVWVLQVIAAACLCAGFRTPWAAALCTLTVVVALFAIPGSQADRGVIAVAISVAVAILGPGAYSIDSVLHGRRRRIVPPED